ncbi:class F sortase [Naumannella sp. ID2617S]|nr:class F sortase [Naumannella sp. ID2617S]
MTGTARTAVAIATSLLMVPPVVWMVSGAGRTPDPAPEPAPLAAAPEFAGAAPSSSEPDGSTDFRAPEQATPTPTPPRSSSPPAPAPPPAPAAAAPAPPAPAGPPGGAGGDGGRTAATAPATGCARGPIRPTRFQVPRMGVNAPMVAVGNDRDGNPGAPPLSQLFTTAWYRGSPAPGSERGNVIINVHSYASGSALGNNLHAANGLRPGDVIKVVGEDGQIACYRYRSKLKISVAAYNPKSKIYHDDHGRPQLAIMTCWDRNARTGVYESRIIFYADRVV